MKIENLTVRHVIFNQRKAIPDPRDIVLEFYHPGTQWTFQFTLEHLLEVSAERMVVQSKRKSEKLAVSDRQTILNASEEYKCQLKNKLCPDYLQYSPRKYRAVQLELERVEKQIYRYNYNPKTKKTLRK